MNIISETYKIRLKELAGLTSKITIHPKEGFSNIKLGNESIGSLDLFFLNKYIILDKIDIWEKFRGQGYAQKAMEQLIDYAKQKNLTITLTPDDAFGSNKNKLIKWYRSLGFVMNKGKNKDFETMQLIYKTPGPGTFPGI